MDFDTRMRESIPDEVSAIPSGTRRCFYVDVLADTDGGYIPSVVFEGISGHYPLAGNGQFASPWVWGPTYVDACRIADEGNAALGLSRQDALDILISSMRAAETRPPSMSVAQLKRTLTPGTVLNVTMHRYPDLCGKRAVVRANTVGMYLTLPDGHPRQADAPDGSFMNWPKASELKVNADGSMTVHFTGWADALMTFTVEPS